MKDGVKVGCLTIVIIIGLSLFALVFKIAILPFFVANKVVDSGTEIINKTLDSDNVMYNYEWFKSQYNSYLALQKKTDEAKAQVKSFEDSMKGITRDKWSPEQTNELARLNTVVSGFQYQLEDCIKEYNARSKMANRSIFKTHDLPEQLE